jgi:hypothetical protein
MSDDITQSVYWKQVKALAQECIKEAGRSSTADRDLYEIVHEMVDSHEWVIYTRFHHQILQHTDQDVAALFEDMGGPDLSKGWDNVVTQAAYLALEGDVLEAISRLERADDSL